MISVSSELLVLRLCLVELKIVNTLSIDITQPVQPIMFGYTVIDPSIQNFSMPLPLALRISGRLLVPLIYFIIWTNLAQSSLSDSLTLAARNETSVHLSGLTHLIANNIFAPR